MRDAHHNRLLERKKRWIKQAKSDRHRYDIATQLTTFSLDDLCRLKKCTPRDSVSGKPDHDSLGIINKLIDAAIRKRRHRKVSNASKVEPKDTPPPKHAELLAIARGEPRKRAGEPARQLLATSFFASRTRRSASATRREEHLKRREMVHLDKILELAEIKTPERFTHESFSIQKNQSIELKKLATTLSRL